MSPLHRSTLAAAVAALFPAAFAAADPLPGEVLKFQQLPIYNLVVGTPIFQGHDELSTAYATPSPGTYVGDFMADDFADKFSTPVVHVSWWGSYIQNHRGVNGQGVQQFLISFESDVPAGPLSSFSRPGTPLLSQVVNVIPAGPTAPGTATESIVNVNLPEALYHYNAELALPFAQQPNTVYWLKIVALTGDNTLEWGWHNRDYRVNDPLASTPPAVAPGERDLGPFQGGPVWHFQDDAVSGRVTVTNLAGTLPLVDQVGFNPRNYLDGIDGPTGIGQYSKDLAFELYTVVPEPASFGVLATAMLTLVSNLPRRRR